MSDDQNSFKDKQTSRREFLKLIGAGSVFLGLGAFGISNVLKNIKGASAMTASATITNTTNATGASVAPTSGNSDIRPFSMNVPEAELTELRRRINATRWPSKELVADRSQGVELATLLALARYWATDYDWRKFEAKLNALPQFITEIDGVDIHFIHVRSRHENALPLIMTHGWPGSVIELLETVGPLTNPTAHGGTAEDAFHLVLPSLPGYGFSREPTELGWEQAATRARGLS